LAFLAIGVFFATNITGDTGQYDVPEANKVVGDVALRVAVEPYDWYQTAQECYHGSCNYLDVAFAVAPVLSGGLSRIDDIQDISKHADDVLDEGRLAGDIAPIGFRRFTESQFSENLRRLTGMTKAETSGLQAHHVLPKQFEDLFEEIGFNIHDPKFGAWVGSEHQSWSTAYNREWSNFFTDFQEAGALPSPMQVIQQANQMAIDYGYEWKFRMMR
jgi:hypothetical protein